MPGQTEQSTRTVKAEDRDQDLVRSARNGDVAAFGELVHRYQRQVHSLVARMTSNADEADDIVQDVFVSAWRGLQNFRGDAQFSTWLHSIAVNAALKRIKKSKGRETLSLDDPENGTAERLKGDNSAGPFERVCSDEERQAVRRALDILSVNHRTTVILYYFEEHSCEEIARIMSCSVGTVWSRLHYACKKLKAELDGIRLSPPVTAQQSK